MLTMTFPANPPTEEIDLEKDEAVKSIVAVTLGGEGMLDQVQEVDDSLFTPMIITLNNFILA